MGLFEHYLMSIIKLEKRLAFEKFMYRALDIENNKVFRRVLRLRLEYAVANSSLILLSQQINKSFHFVAHLIDNDYYEVTLPHKGALVKVIFSGRHLDNYNWVQYSKTPASPYSRKIIEECFLES